MTDTEAIAYVRSMVTPKSNERNMAILAVCDLAERALSWQERFNEEYDDLNDDEIPERPLTEAQRERFEAAAQRGLAERRRLTD